MNNFISVLDLTPDDIKNIFELTDSLKANPFRDALKNKALVLIFQKPSNRTRVSFEVGMRQLGGSSIYLGPQEIDMGGRESVSDVARTLSRYADAIVLRTHKHQNVIDFAEYASVPVINGLSDYSHPCQALCDIYTILEKKRRLAGLTFAYLGDGNNVCNSLIISCAKTGMSMNIATPLGYEPDKYVVSEGIRMSKDSGAKIHLTDSPPEAVRGADVIYTDVWTSMGQEKEADKRRKDFKGFQIDAQLVSEAKPDFLFMHCLPAHKGEEVSEEVFESKNSVVFDQAENRLHVQKAILLTLLNNSH